MTDRPVEGRVEQGYVEPGGSWRPFWLVTAALAVLLLLDVLLPGGDVPPLLWVVAIVAVLGVIGIGTLSAQRVWTVRVTEAGLSVGREQVALTEIDGGHLRAVDAGVDAGAPVLGGGWSLPRGRTGLPLRLTDGRTLLVPTRNPAALHGALLAGLPGAPDDRSGSQGRLDP